MAFGKNFKGGARDYGRPREDRGGGFKKSWAPRDGAQRGGGFGDRGDRGPVEMFSATCANCNKACEVPFRPSGERPVYCKECFGTMKGADDSRRPDAGSRGGFGGGFGAGRDYKESRVVPSAAVSDASTKKIDELAKKVDALAKSLDYAITLLKGTGAPLQKVQADTPAAPSEKNSEKPGKELRLAKKASSKTGEKKVKAKAKK